MRRLQYHICLSSKTRYDVICPHLLNYQYITIQEVGTVYPLSVDYMETTNLMDAVKLSIEQMKDYSFVAKKPTIIRLQVCGLKRL